MAFLEISILLLGIRNLGRDGGGASSFLQVWL